MFAKTKQGEKNLPKPAVWHLFLIKCPQIFFVSKSIHSDSPILPLSQSELLLKLFFYGEHEKRNEERSQDFCINELSRLRDPGCALSLTMHSRCFCPLLSLFMQSSNKACCLQTGKECPHPQKLSVANVWPHRQKIVNTSLKRLPRRPENFQSLFGATEPQTPQTCPLWVNHLKKQSYSPPRKGWALSRIDVYGI